MTSDQQFEWDEAKRLSNIEKHGLDFRDAVLVFGGRFVRWPCVGHDEERWMAVGILNGLEVAVIFTMRSSVVRIISARRAYRRERKNYYACNPG
jgi:uncharacterized protein